MGELAIRHHYTGLSRQLGSMKVLETELQRDCWASGTDNFSFGNTSIFISNFFWQWWSRGWKTSDTAFFPSLLSNLIKDLAKVYFFSFLFFFFVFVPDIFEKSRKLPAEQLHQNTLISFISVICWVISASIACSWSCGWCGFKSLEREQSVWEY